MKQLKWTTVGLLLFTIFVFSPLQSLAAFQFSDVPKDREYFKEVHYIAEKGIINKDAKFNPKDNLRRSHVAKMLVIAKGKQNTPLKDMKIVGLEPGTEQYKYANIALQLGYFKLDSNGRFNPNETIQREEMAFALSEAFNLSEKVTSQKPLMLTDVTKHPYAERINGLYYAGITRGDSGKFLPTSKLTRSQFALFVARALDDQFKVKVITPDQQSSIQYVKVATGDDNDPLNVRSGPSATTTVLKSLANGTIIEVIGQSGEWLKINASGTIGYVHQYYTTSNLDSKPVTKPSEPAPAPTPTPAAKLIGKVTVNSLNVRSAGNSSASTIDKITLGTRVEVESINGYWAKIRYSGKTGYVHKSYLKLVNQSGNPLRDRIIVIDAGHGAHDPGAVSNKLAEKTITLDVAKRVEAKLKRAGAKVLMTRSTDVFHSLEQRTQFAKKNYAETFVSIHVNSASSSAAKGAEVFYDSSANPNANESKNLAALIQKNIVQRANMVDRGVKNNRFYVIRNNNVAAVLVELGFISNADDRNKLASAKYADIFAEAIYQGLYQYYSNY